MVPTKKTDSFYKLFEIIIKNLIKKMNTKI